MCFQYTNHHRHWRYRACGPVLCDTGFHEAPNVSSKPNASGWIEIPVWRAKTWKGFFSMSCSVYFLSVKLFTIAAISCNHDVPMTRLYLHGNFSYKCWPVSFPPSLPFTLSPQRPVFTCQWHLYDIFFYANKDLETIALKAEGSPQKRHTVYHKQRAWHHHQWDQSEWVIKSRGMGNGESIVC